MDSASEIPSEDELARVVDNRGIPVSGVELLDAGAVALAHDLWRNTDTVEGWHSSKSGFNDGDMMRENAAVTRLVRKALDSLDHQTWANLARKITHPDRVLVTGSKISDAMPAEDVLRLREEATDAARMYRLLSTARSERFALLFGLANPLTDTCWWGMSRWPAIVERFVQALEDPDDPHWRGHGAATLAERPDTIASPSDLAGRLLAGPDTLSTREADWLVDRAALGFVKV